MGGYGGYWGGKGLGKGLGFGLGVRVNIRFDFIRFFVGDNIEAIIIIKEDGCLILIHSHSVSRFRVQVQRAKLVH
jgi:hypothetical protein